MTLLRFLRFWPFLVIFGVFWPFLVIFGVFRRFGDFRVFGSFWAVFGVFSDFVICPYKCLVPLILVSFVNLGVFRHFGVFGVFVKLRDSDNSPGKLFLYQILSFLF